MSKREEKRLKKLKERRQRAEASKVHNQIQKKFHAKDYEWGRIAVFTVVGVVLGTVVLLNIFK